jgi:hypothetical protein
MSSRSRLQHAIVACGWSIVLPTQQKGGAARHGTAWHGTAWHGTAFGCN